MTTCRNERRLEQNLLISPWFVLARTGKLKDEFKIIYACYPSLDVSLAGIDGGIPTSQSYLKRLLALRFLKEIDVVSSDPHLEEAPPKSWRSPVASDPLRESVTCTSAEA